MALIVTRSRYVYPFILKRLAFEFKLPLLLAFYLMHIFICEAHYVTVTVCQACPRKQLLSADMFEFVCLRLEETFLMDSISTIGRPFITGGTENVTQLCVLTNVCLHTEYALIPHSDVSCSKHGKVICSHVAFVTDDNTTP
jgi:hypothetical protein